MIELQAVSKVFRTDVIETYALREFDLKIGAGEFVAITGHSGSGKTTLLNVAGLLEEFEAGSYRLDSEDVKALSDNERSRIRNRKIGFVFQGFNLMRHLPAQLSGGQQQRAAIARAIGGEPHIVLADEPTGNLDTTMSAQIMDLLQSINEAGTTILIVTHNEELARRAKRRVHMVDGRIATDQSDQSAVSAN
jgi:putative ABC transport system ATP-binding protein